MVNRNHSIALGHHQKRRSRDVFQPESVKSTLPSWELVGPIDEVTQAILAALEPRESISEDGEYSQNKSLEDESTDDDLSDLDDLQIPEPS